MKSIAVILGVAGYLLLIATEGQCNDEEQAVVEQQMLEDLADLVRMRKEQQSDEPQSKYPTPGPKTQITLPCSYYKYGCCQDGKTKAKGPDKQGCGDVLCADNAVAYCMRNKNNLDCTKGSVDYERCTYTCGCPNKLAAASLLQKCMSSRTPFGCCWNGQPALFLHKKDCPPCRDLTPHTCRQFRLISNGCSSGSYGIRIFMQRHCPMTCGACYRKK